MAYYGLRSIAVVYAVKEFHLSEGEALSNYGYLTSLVYISILFGGFLSDLVLGARNGLLIGFGLCTIGAMGVVIPDPAVFYVGAVFIALGTGFVRPSTFSIIGHGTDIKNSVLLEKRFISMYTVINLGAFLGSLVLGLLGERYGFLYAVLPVIFLFGLSFILTFSLNPKRNSTLLKNYEANTEPRPITKSLLIVMLTVITSAVFWMVYDRYSMNISYFKIQFMRSALSGSSISEIIWSITTILFIFLAIPYYFVARRFSMFLKIAIGMALIGLCWLAGVLLESEILGFGVTLLFVLSLLESLAELFVSPIALTLLSKHTSKRYYGIVFGVSSIIAAFGMRILLNTELAIIEYVVYVGLITVIVVSILLYSILASKDKRERNAAAAAAAHLEE